MGLDRSSLRWGEYGVNERHEAAKGLRLWWQDHYFSVTGLFHGTPNGGVRRAPVEGSASGFFFDGSNDYISAPALETILGRTSGAWTVRVVAMSTTTTTRQGIAGCVNSGYDNRSVFFEISGFGQTSKSIAVVGAGSGTGGFLNSNVLADNNTYYDIVATWNGATRIIYVNGVSRNSDSVGWTTGGTITALGRPGDLNGLYLNGRVKVFQIWDRALPAHVVRDLYRNGDELKEPHGRRTWFVPSAGGSPWYYRLQESLAAG